MTLTGNTTEIKVAPATSGMSPTYNETIVVLESPNIQSDNFKWIVDIWIDALPNAVGSTKITQLVILPNPDGFGVLDVHRHIENYISSTFQPADLDTTNVAPECFRLWSLDVTEQFENPVWRFTTNKLTSGGQVGFINNDSNHPFANGDVVSVEQDPGFTYSGYNTTATTLTIINEIEVETTLGFSGATGNEPGLMTLVSGGTRIIYQEDIALNLYNNFNGVIDFADFNSFNINDYNMNAVTMDGLFLTNIENNAEIDRDSHLWINGFSEARAYTTLVVQTDNGQFLIEPISPVPAFNDTFITQAKVGPADLLVTTSTINVLAGVLPIVDANTSFIYVRALNGFAPLSETKRFTIVDKCSKYEKIQFFFLDRLGSYIPLTFNMISRTNVTNSRSNYKQNYGNYDSVANAWGYTTHSRGTTTYDIVSTKRVTCDSDWLDDAGVELVNILLRSPDVYYIDEAGVYRAITITTNTYEIKKKENRGLRNYTISFEYAQNDGNQR